MMTMLAWFLHEGWVRATDRTLSAGHSITDDHELIHKPEMEA